MEADLLAQALVANNPEPLFQLFYKHGKSAESQAFGADFIQSSTKVSINSIKGSLDPFDALTTTLPPYLEAISLLNDKQFADAIQHYKITLFENFPEFLYQGSDIAFLNMKALTVFANALENLPINVKQQEIATEILTKRDIKVEQAPQQNTPPTNIENFSSPKESLTYSKQDQVIESTENLVDQIINKGIVWESLPSYYINAETRDFFVEQFAQQYSQGFVNSVKQDDFPKIALNQGLSRFAQVISKFELEDFSYTANTLKETILNQLVPFTALAADGVKLNQDVIRVVETSFKKQNISAEKIEIVASLGEPAPYQTKRLKM